MEKEKVILDVDPGSDDAIAIAVAGRHPRIELLAITAVAGNQTLEKTAKNALKVCSYLGITGVPIAAGMSHPLVREPVTAANIHGESGLNGVELEEPKLALDPRHAVDLIVEALSSSSGDINFVATAPLTNIAVALRKEPGITKKIKRIVMMGGSYGLGNITPAAEFNVYADPEAAHVVFSSGVPIVMMGLDLTHQAVVTQDVIKRVECIDNEASRLFVGLMDFYSTRYRERFGFDGAPLHDPTTLAWLIDPSIVETKAMHVDVELRGEHTYGRTVCDYWCALGKPPNANVGVRLEVERFWDAICEALSFYS